MPPGCVPGSVKYPRRHHQAWLSRCRPRSRPCGGHRRESCEALGRLDRMRNGDDLRPPEACAYVLVQSSAITTSTSTGTRVR
jgi:hypothetical protein